LTLFLQLFALSVLCSTCSLAPAASRFRPPSAVTCIRKKHRDRIAIRGVGSCKRTRAPKGSWCCSGCTECDLTPVSALFKVRSVGTTRIQSVLYAWSCYFRQSTCSETTRPHTRPWSKLRTLT